MEHPLTGGRVTPGVVRMGDTVRRPLNPNSGFVHQLLRHLENRGFHACPRVVGADDGCGREVLSYVPGEVPRDLGWFDEHQLGAAAGLIRRFHDATAGSPLAGTAEVVCHNDLSPCNFVFNDGIPQAMIDFDAAAPGARVADLAYAAWLWLDIGNDEIGAAEQARRLRLFAGHYGWEGHDALLVAMMRAQETLIARADARGWQDTVNWARHCADWTTAHLGSAPHRRP